MVQESDYGSFYESLKYHLDKKGHGGQALVCRHTGIPRSYLSRIFKKDRRAGHKTQRKIARFFGHNLKEFVEVGRRITLGESPEALPDLMEKLPTENLIQRLTDAVRKEMSTAQLLNRTQQLYEDIVENSKQIIIRFDKNLTISFANRAFELLTGKERISVMGLSWRTCIDACFHDKMTHRISAISDGGGTFSIEVCSDMVNCWFSLTVTVFPVNHSGLDRMQWVGFDVTEEVMARREIEKNQQQLKELVDRLRFIQHGVERSYVPTLWVSDQANIVYANKAACALLGYSLPELERLHVWEINPLISEKEWGRKWQWFTREEEVVFDGQYCTKDGTIISVQFHVSNLQYPDGRRYNVVFVSPRDGGKGFLKREKVT